MKTSGALCVLAELSASQWGMVTTAQAAERGVSRLDLSRLADVGHLVRLSHGVYRDAGAPSDEFEDLRTAWLSTDPGTPAERRLSTPESDVIVAGTSAARLHGVGDLPADRHEFVTPVRRQSQRRAIHYRQRELEPRDVTMAHGLPVTTVERTIADLVEARTDLSLVADVFRDATRKSRLDTDRLGELLAPLAARHGFSKGDGAVLFGHLLDISGAIEDLASRLRRLSSLSRVTIVGMTDVAAPAAEQLIGHTGGLVDAHRAELRDVLRRHGVTNPRLFGSVARGDDHPGSDVDLLVDFAPGTGLFAIAKIQAELEEILGVEVDLVPDAGLKDKVRARVEPDLIAL